jgi:hypothetical protein
MDGTVKSYALTLTSRQMAILGALLSRSRGWDEPLELHSFVNICADSVRDGWSDLEMSVLLEHLAGVALGEGQPDHARRALRLAKEATNGWGCYAKRNAELANISQLHSEIAAIEREMAQ